MTINHIKLYYKYINSLSKWAVAIEYSIAQIDEYLYRPYDKFSGTEKIMESLGFGDAREQR